MSSSSLLKCSNRDVYTVTIFEIFIDDKTEIYSMLILVSLYADRLFQSKLSSRPCKMDTLKVPRPAVQVIAHWIKNENGFNQSLNSKYHFQR